MKIAVGIATAGRGAILGDTLWELARQTRLPDIVFVCPAVPDDMGGCDKVDWPFVFQVVYGDRGSAAQRNAILAVSSGYDVMIFLDDDFFLQNTYIGLLENCFASSPDVVAVSGLVIADGVTGPGIKAAEARALLACWRDDDTSGLLTDQYNAYGCNMCTRLRPIRSNALLFDENLPLYGWLEDVDFCRRLAIHGRVVKNRRMIGVHLGTKSGRTSGLRFGYSQVANPIYIWRKKSTGFLWAIRHIGKNMLANIRQLPAPEPWVDRRGRVKGNAIALYDLVRGRLDPRRILDFE